MTLSDLPDPVPEDCGPFVLLLLHGIPEFHPERLDLFGRRIIPACVPWSCSSMDLRSMYLSEKGTEIFMEYLETVGASVTAGSPQG